MADIQRDMTIGGDRIAGVEGVPAAQYAATLTQLQAKYLIETVPEYWRLILEAAFAAATAPLAVGNASAPIPFDRATAALTPLKSAVDRYRQATGRPGGDEVLDALWTQVQNKQPPAPGWWATLPPWIRWTLGGGAVVFVAGTVGRALVPWFQIYRAARGNPNKR